MKQNNNALYKGILMMLLSATLACIGQLLWKLASRNDSIILIIVGLALYGFGALLMILALRYGELSVLHPMMSVGYILSLILGAAVLNEEISLVKVVGVATIILGLVFLSSSETGAEK